MAKEKIGQRLYRFVNGNLYQCRLVKVYNDNCYAVVADSGLTVKLTKAEYDNYTKLREDGVIVFSNVMLQDGIPDVIVSMFRQSDLSTGLPYCVCRNNVFDIFSNSIENDGGKMYIGCSVSKDTCPENIDFRMFVACNSVEYTEIVAIYYDDNIDTIMNLLKKSYKFDETLALLKAGFDEKTRGSVSTLRELLETNHFLADIRRGFNIITAPIGVYSKETEPFFNRVIEDYIKRRIISPTWVPFTRDIDLNRITDSYNLVIDSANNIYVVSYAEGEYCNDSYLAMGDMTEVEALRNLVV